jgi:hypothetical protein
MRRWGNGRGGTGRIGSIDCIADIMFVCFPGVLLAMKLWKGNDLPCVELAREPARTARSFEVVVAGSKYDARDHFRHPTCISL